jgi:hypothetical protein
MIGYSVVYLLEEGHDMPNGNYVEKNLFNNDIVIKVAVSLPYQVSWDYPEPAEGKVLHDGVHYRMKSRQLINDTIYVHCEFDQNARDRYTALVSKIQDEIAGGAPQKDVPSNRLKHFLKEFLVTGRKHVFYLLEWAPPHTPVADRYQLAVSEEILHTASPPPDRA